MRKRREQRVLPAEIGRNIREICKLEQDALRDRTFGQRAGDMIAALAGRPWFAVVHIIWFACWILWNTRPVGHSRPFDPYPFEFLILVVSLESIFLSLFILISQNRASVQAEHRAHLDLQINLLSEMEATRILRLLHALCAREGLPEADDPKIKELLARTDAKEVASALRDTLQS